MAKPASAAKRPRRERGSLNADEILDGAFELAREVGIDNMSMPMLGKHLDVGVTSIYWYFRKKDDLLNAMTDRALDDFRIAAPLVDAGEWPDWREFLANYSIAYREAFLASPILCDLVLIRSALSPEASREGAKQTEDVVTSLVAAGFALEDAVDIYSAIQLHVRGTLVLQRLYDRNEDSGAESSAYYDNLAITPETTPLLAAARNRGLHSGAPDDRNFRYGLECILDHAARVLESTTAAQPSRPAKKAPAPRKRTAAKTSE